jgi:hypothetical protein
MEKTSINKNNFFTFFAPFHKKKGQGSSPPLLWSTYLLPPLNSADLITVKIRGVNLTAIPKIRNPAKEPTTAILVVQISLDVKPQSVPDPIMLPPAAAYKDAPILVKPPIV